MKTFSFEKLTAWQKAREFAHEIYKVTKTFPKEEQFGIISQISKYAISIASNVAEGSGRNSMQDNARFSEIAYGSALELLTQLIFSYDFEFISENKYSEIREKQQKLLC